METKKEIKEDRIRLRHEIGRQLYLLRQEKNLTTTEVAILSKIPVFHIEEMELFGLTNLKLIELQALANFYGKYVKVKLVDKEEL